MKCFHVIPVAALIAFSLAINPVDAAKRSAPTARARFAQINRDLGRYRIVKRKLTGYSPEGGTLRAYLLHGSPRKMVAYHYGESGKAIEEYYFWNHRLFFVLRAVFTYDQPFGKVKRTGEHRFHFSNGKLVRWQKDRKLMPLSLQEAKDYEESTLLMARELLQTARS